MCTLGPATSSQERLEEIIEAGMDVARFNMSHGSHAEHRERLDALTAAADKVGKVVAVLCDLQGPKIRLGTFANGKEELAQGDTFTITIDDVEGTNERASTTYKGLPGDVKPGDRLLVDDGNIALEAVEVTDTDVTCRVVVAGRVSNHKGINLPGVAVSVPAMSDKDEEDLRWALRNGADLIALSFVRDAADVTRVHEIMDEEGHRLPVIAKLEKPQAIENLDAIIDAFDGFMVARGDLGVELPLEEVPLVQKRIVTAARRWAKPVIVATQMLESMISSPRPTRAEASDVANAVLDGADAVMLSGETSVGEYPVQTVQTMARIVNSTEHNGIQSIRPLEWTPHTTGGIMTKAALDIADAVGARYICAFTKSGDTARRLSRMRPEVPFLVFTPEERTIRELSLTWGSNIIKTPELNDSQAMVKHLNQVLVQQDLVEVGERVVIISGRPMGLPGKTNNVQVHRIRPLDESGEVIGLDQ